MATKVNDEPKQNGCLGNECSPLPTEAPMTDYSASRLTQKALSVEAVTIAASRRWRWRQANPPVARVVADTSTAGNWSVDRTNIFSNDGLLDVLTWSCRVRSLAVEEAWPRKEFIFRIMELLGGEARVWGNNLLQIDRSRSQELFLHRIVANYRAGCDDQQEARMLFASEYQRSDESPITYTLRMSDYAKRTALCIPDFEIIATIRKRFHISVSQFFNEYLQYQCIPDINSFLIKMEFIQDALMAQIDDQCRAKVYVIPNLRLSYEERLRCQIPSHWYI